MKKILSAAAVIVLSAISLQSMAQTATAFQAAHKKAVKKEERAIRKHEVSELTVQQFKVDFPGATNVASIRNGMISEFGFIQNNVQQKAYYDMDNGLIGTTSRKQVSDLPASAVKNIQKYYAGYGISKVILFDDNEANENDMLLYGRQFDDADNYFVELSKDDKTIILQVKLDGEVFFFQNI